MAAPLAGEGCAGDHALRDAREASLRRSTGLRVVNLQETRYAMDHPYRL